MWWRRSWRKARALPENLRSHDANLRLLNGYAKKT
jgi:hypothetical protein